MAGARRLIGVFSFVGLLFLLLREGSVRADEPVEATCAETVSSWSEAQLHALSSLPPNSVLDRLKLHNLLFFLHIPRTGGRTFHQCFLKHLFASDVRCPRSYDKLRIDRSQPGCRLISTHDDYSLLEKLSQEMTSVVTSLREPIDRVLSSYEFSIEVAARSLRPSTKKFLPVTPASNSSKVSKFMNTLDIWPWKYLVPTMQADLFVRREARLGSKTNSGLAVRKNATWLPGNNSYDAASFAMPFREFIHHPLALELVHNGATFQVAGLTNTSYLEDAGLIRTCVVRYPHIGKYVLKVAKKRLDRMLYVGLTDRQNDSAVFFAKVVGRQVSMETLLRSMLNQKRFRSPRSPQQETRASKLPSNFTSLDELKEEDVIKELLACYGECVADLRKTQEDRRSLSLDMISPIKFSREERGFIPKSVIEEVAHLNRLDGELYAHAQLLFAREQEFLQHGDFHINQTRDPEKFRGNHYIEVVSYTDDYEYFWRLLQVICDMLAWILSMVLVVLVVVIYLVTKRRGARVKET